MGAETLTVQRGVVHNHVGNTTAVKAAGLTKRIGWHTFRHTYSTLLRSVGAEFKVMQELMRHSSLRSTIDIYTQAVTPAKRAGLLTLGAIDREAILTGAAQ